jgi:hypothetical protein
MPGWIAHGDSTGRDGVTAAVRPAYGGSSPK